MADELTPANPAAGALDLDELEYAEGGLTKGTNWWGAFVVGLAGTILVTGIAPVMVTTLGAASVPLNMILASFYLADRFNLNVTSGFTPINTFIAWWTLGIAIVGILLFFIPAYLGIRIGAGFATVLGIISMVPLTFLAVAFIFTGDADWGQLSGFHQLDGSGFFSGLEGHNWFTLYMGYSFLLTWNVIAMEAAACYIGETRDPDKDAKIAMDLEGVDGLVIYTLIPIAFITVLGAKALSNSDLVDPNTIFVTFAGKIFNTGGELLNWLIAGMLIIALMLSALNAIMGCARSLHQMSVDGQFPRFFQKINKNGVPDRAMFFNVICSLAVVLAGGAVEIYTFSNVGYTGSFLTVLVGYYLLRKYRPNARRPVRLPEPFQYVALGMAVLYFVIWLYGGVYFSKIGNTLVY